jgi:predicted transcriptional regulator
MPENRLTQLTSDIVSAFVERNPVSISDLPELIRLVHSALHAPAGAALEAEAAAHARPTATQIRKSITPDALISFEDGRSYTMLRRHLRAVGLTPEAYRAKWGLPVDYPMVAPNYSARRSEFAKAAGLGTITRKAANGAVRRRRI